MQRSSKNQNKLLLAWSHQCTILHRTLSTVVLEFYINVPSWVQRQVSAFKHISDKYNRNWTFRAKTCSHMEWRKIVVPFVTISITSQEKYFTPSINKLYNALSAFCQNAFKSETLDSIFNKQASRQVAITIILLEATKCSPAAGNPCQTSLMLVVILQKLHYFSLYDIRESYQGQSFSLHKI